MLNSDVISIKLLNNGCAIVRTLKKEWETPRSFAEGLIVALRSKGRKEYFVSRPFGAQEYIFN